MLKYVEYFNCILEGTFIMKKPQFWIILFIVTLLFITSSPVAAHGFEIHEKKPKKIDPPLR